MTDGRRNPRTPYPTQVPGIPKPPAGTPPALQRYLTNLSEALEIRLGRKGDVRDRAITLRELIESGLAVDLANNPYDPNNPGNDFGGTNFPDSEVPPAPTNFSATAGFSNVGLFWDWPGYQYRGHSFTEIWRNTANNLETAILVGISPGMAYTDVVGAVATETTYYYWARHVNVNNVEGPFHANSGLEATLAANPAFLLDVLEGAISSTELADSLSAPIGRIPDIESYIGYSSEYTGSSLLNRIVDTEGDIVSITGVLPVDADGNLQNVPTAASLNALSATVTTQGESISANASNISAVTATLPTDPDGNLINVASASALSSLESTVSANEDGIEANSEAITAVETVLPVDANGDFINAASATALNALNTTVSDQGEEISANSSAITAVEAVLPTDANGNFVNTATASGLSTLEATVTNSTTGLSATVSRVDTLQTEVFDANGNSRLASLEVTGTIEDDVDSLEAQYTVKISQESSTGATYVTGYGLALSDVDGTPSSAFIVAADRFAVINPATYNGGMDNTPSATTVPFVVQSTASTVTLDSGEQVTVPAGVYMREGFLSKATILELIAGSVTADFVLASTFIRAPNIHGGTFNIGSFSTNNSSDPSDWTISGSNRVSNFSVDANGIMHCEAAELRAITVFADDGTVLVDAGGMFEVGSLIKNSNLQSTSTSLIRLTNTAGTEVIPFWSTADSSSGEDTTSYWGTQGVFQFTSSHTIRSERFPVTRGETLYLAIDNFMNNPPSGNSRDWEVAVQFFSKRVDPSGTSSYYTQEKFRSYVSSDGWGDTQPTEGGRRLSQVAVPVPDNNNAKYASIRFYGGDKTYTYNPITQQNVINNGDAYVNIWSVYIGRTPKQITPEYASTYIRDLSVDTLQIAGNAVTVPIGISDVNKNTYVAYSGVGTDTGEGTNWGYASHTGSVGGLTAVPLSWETGKAPQAINVFGCANIQGQSGSDFKTIRMRLIRSTSPSFANPVEIQRIGTSSKTNMSSTISLNATIDVEDENLSANTNYYFAIQVHANDYVFPSTPFKLMGNGITVLAAKK